MDLGHLGQNTIVGDGLADVARIRRRRLLRRLLVGGALFLALDLWLAWRYGTGNPLRLGLPEFGENAGEAFSGILLTVGLFAVIVFPMVLAGRSPHTQFRPSEIDTRLDDVVGIPNVRDEVVRTLNLFLGFKTFRDRMGGTPRRGVLFEGPPGTGKTHMAKAMAAEAGVPFLFVSASSFQSMYYGQTNRKIRAFFRAMRKAARAEGGAIGFIDEFDAIATARNGMRVAAVRSGVEAGTETLRSEGMSESLSGIVNELLVQMQSFDTPTAGQRVRGVIADACNVWLPAAWHVPKPKPTRANVLLIGATNRADALDPALLRPGRFDRTIHFNLPSRQGRREVIDYYLARKSHDADLDRDLRRDQLATMTIGYSPVMIEHLFDEALVWALRDGREEMTWADVQQAKLTEETGLKEPVDYVDHERDRIATHEAGHAVVAYLAGKGRKLDVLTIVKRGGALGLLAHSDEEERFTLTRSELLARIHIAFGGLVAEEQFFGEFSTGPASDLQYATRVAAQMVGSFGMSGSFVSLDAMEMSGIVRKTLADETGRMGVDDLLSSAHEYVTRLLAVNRHLVVALRDALLDRDELIGDEILAVIDAAEAAVVDARTGSDFDEAVRGLDRSD